MLCRMGLTDSRKMLCRMGITGRMEHKAHASRTVIMAGMGMATGMVISLGIR